jgi:threonine/homoserine/homoserine lactone efflux protein
MNTYLILGVSFAFAAAVQPGPLQSFLITQTLTNGWKKTIIASFSPLISDIPIIAITLLLLVQLPPKAIHIIQVAGGIYLLYLSFEAYKTFRKIRQNEVIISQKPVKTLFKAVFVNLLNPNPYLAWSLVMGPLLLKAWDQSIFNGILLIASFYLTLVSCLFGTIMLISLGKNFGAAVNRALLGISVIALAAFGIYEIGSGLWQ